MEIIFAPQQPSTGVTPLSWQAVLSSLDQQTALVPFGAQQIDFVASLSRRILLDRTMRAFPEAMALANWFRRVNLIKLERDFAANNAAHLARARGLVFHLAPSNVDSIFMYSWLLSVLAGNKNIVRLSLKRGEQAAALTNALTATLNDAEFSVVANRNAIFSYGHDDSITASISACCDTRVIWGGDNTVNHIRKIPIPPRTTELTFADRFSFSLINAAYVAQMPATALKDIAERFFNDVYWFDQQACSSPRLIIWVGDSAVITTAQTIFWDAVNAIVMAKSHAIDPSLGVTKFATAMEYAASSQATSIIHENANLTRVHLPSLSNFSRERHCGGGFFLEAGVRNLTDAAPWVSKKEQTVSVLGFDRRGIGEFLNAVGHSGIDRVVQFGNALSFSDVWDGFDLLQSFTRKVTIDPSELSN
jgi:Acyl-CoA reductase (LuxC)